MGSYSGSVLGSLRVAFSDAFGRVLGTLETLWVHFWGTLGTPGANFGSLGGFCGTLGVPFGFGVPFRRLLGSFLDTLNTFICFS